MRVRKESTVVHALRCVGANVVAFPIFASALGIALYQTQKEAGTHPVKAVTLAVVAAPVLTTITMVENFGM